MDEVARQVESHAQRLAALSLEEMYDDPFWRARYGEERARRFGSEDALFHVRYLVQALDLHDPGVMERYARWLQGLLVPRGMSSRHIAFHFQGLRAALRREGLDLERTPQVGATLDAAEAALLYPSGPARALQLAAPELAQKALAHLPQGGDVAARERLTEEVLLQLSYLADALGTGRPSLFADHVRWYTGFWPQRGLPGTFAGMLAALEEVLASESTLAGEPRTVLAAGRAVFEERRP
jgi:hypothetical protein